MVKLVNLLIYQAVRDGCSDIHIEPFEKKIRVRYRQDGSLRETISPPRGMQNAIVSRIKIMANLDIAERRRPQDGKFQIRLDGRNVDFRVSILPTIHGEKVVMRILDSGNLALNLDSLGFEQKALDDFRQRHRLALRDDPRDGSHGLREVHHALLVAARDDEDRGQHHHGRGPGGIPARRGQPGGGEREARTDLRGARCGRSCGRTPTSSWSGRSATRRRWRLR